MNDAHPAERPGDDPALLRAVDLTRVFGKRGVQVNALRGVSLTAAPGEVVAIRGRSGSGKTTLMNIIGGLDRPTTGTVALAGTDLATLDERHRVLLRRADIGFVFQSFGLIPYLTVAENVGMPLHIARERAEARDARVAETLGLVGLTSHARHRPAELSGGQQQRVAVARALAQRPRVLIADEPTGQLDSRNGFEVLRLLRQVADSEGTAVVVSTHDQRVAEIADTVLRLRDGRFAE